MMRADVNAASLIQQCRLTGVPLPQTELFFAKSIGRRWRFDLAWPDFKLAVEIDGGVYVQGRHTRGAGVEADNEKIASAMMLGWRVLKVTPRQVKSGQALAWIQAILQPYGEYGFGRANDAYLKSQEGKR